MWGVLISGVKWLGETEQKAEVIAIDGPAGAGKSTVARRVAQRLGWIYIDTGAMYRAVCLKALRTGIPVEDGMALAELARSSTIEFCPSPQGEQVLLDGRDVTGDIRSPEVTAHVSQVAAQAGLRRELMRLQRLLALEGRTVVDGRDIGTCVVPEAGLKVFLTAEFQTRVERRYAELLDRGFEVTAAEVAQNMAARDKLDSGREVAPLQKAKDAVVIDTTGLSIAEVVQRVVDE